jgi:hypothetical protein
MPYVIRVPDAPQLYATNDSRIYMDCWEAFNWECESRPFCDTYYKALRDEKDFRHLSAKRREELEAYCLEEVERRKGSERVLATKATLSN